MAHMAGNEPNFDISSKKYDVQKTVPQKYKTAWALGLKGPKLAQMAKTILRGLESQTRPDFHTVLVPEYGFYIKIPNNVKRR